MGAYNTVYASACCPRCGQHVDVVVQFKYGDTWQHRFHLFDTIRWGGNDFGKRGAGRVVVDGIAEQPCSACGYDDEWSLYVYVENDKITEVESATGLYDFVAEVRTYIVLRD